MGLQPRHGERTCSLVHRSPNVRSARLLRARDDTPELAAEFDRHLGTYYPLYRDGHLLEARRRR
jgi:hypothetical protein